MKKSSLLFLNKFFDKVYPYNHSFSEIDKDENGKATHMKNHMSVVMKETLDWLEKL